MSSLQVGRHDPLRLVERAGRKSQVNRTALVAFLALHVPETPAHDDSEFVDKGRLERGQAILRHADQGRRDRLMRAALRRQRNARRRRRHHEARVLVAGVVQGIETALDEGIVQGRDRQQPFAVDGVRQPQRRHQDEQVHLGDAEFDVLSFRRKIPVEGRGYLLASEQIGLLGAREQPAAIDPGAEIGRHRDVGRRGDDARCEFGIAAREFVEHEPETLLGRHRGDGLNASRCGHVDAPARQAAAAVAVERRIRRETLPAPPAPAKVLRTFPIRGRAGCSARCAISPSG